MDKRLCSVGLDVGTTSTQLIFSELEVENRAGSFCVPEMVIARRRILYQSPVYFTPLLDEERVDGPALREIVDREYGRAGISRDQVDTGAIIITGETSRKENARTVLAELAGYAGDFVVATAGPDLESVLAARGAGAVAWSEQTGKTVLHMDIGGGTSNLALIRDGRILQTGCLNVGGRLVKLDEKGIVGYVSPVLKGMCTLTPGQVAARRELEALAAQLVQALEMAAGLREPTGLLQVLTTPGTSRLQVEGPVTLSFSGGVADCIEQELPWLRFGDLGPVLGQAIRESRLCRGEYMLGSQTIRATVIGAGCHSAQLSGSTVFHRNIRFPLKNLPVAAVPEAIRDSCDFSRRLDRELQKLDGPGVLALEGNPLQSYEALRQLAGKLAAALPSGPILVSMEQDMAKAMGQALALLLPEDRPVLCIDRVRLEAGSYLDVGAPVGPALPVVIKTLVLGS